VSALNVNLLRFCLYPIISQCNNLCLAHVKLEGSRANVCHNKALSCRFLSTGMKFFFKFVFLFSFLHSFYNLVNFLLSFFLRVFSFLYFFHFGYCFSSCKAPRESKYSLYVVFRCVFMSLFEDNTARFDVFTKMIKKLLSYGM
jgi:hypothetical protein